MTATLRYRRLWPALAAVAIALVACSRSDPERELRTAVAAMAQAIEQREPAGFLDSVSDESRASRARSASRT